VGAAYRAAALRAWKAWANSRCNGNAELRAILMRRTLTVTTAPILSAYSDANRPLIPS